MRRKGTRSPRRCKRSGSSRRWSVVVLGTCDWDLNLSLTFSLIALPSGRSRDSRSPSDHQAASPSRCSRFSSPNDRCTGSYLCSDDATVQVSLPCLTRWPADPTSPLTFLLSIASFRRAVQEVERQTNMDVITRRQPTASTPILTKAQQQRLHAEPQPRPGHPSGGPSQSRKESGFDEDIEVVDEAAYSTRSSLITHLPC
jgi:hypothetical protein